jgi:hypothetical protein
MKLLKIIWHFFFPKKTVSFDIVEPKEIPFHIKEIGKLYPILHTVTANKALGEIKLFIFKNRVHQLRVGQAAVIQREKYTCTWIHLGHDYFKLVMKA